MIKYILLISGLLLILSISSCARVFPHIEDTDSMYIKSATDLSANMLTPRYEYKIIVYSDDNKYNGEVKGIFHYTCKSKYIVGDEIILETKPRFTPDVYE